MISSVRRVKRRVAGGNPVYRSGPGLIAMRGRCSHDYDTRKQENPHPLPLSPRLLVHVSPQASQPDGQGAIVVGVLHELRVYVPTLSR